MRNEPVLTVSAVVAVITAGLQWARLMGWIDWTDDQFNQFMLFVSLLLPILGGLWARSRVTPTANPKAADGTPLVKVSEYQ
jgi:hypothetical protein